MAHPIGDVQHELEELQRGPKETLQEYWEEVFDRYDYNRDGHIDILEFIDFATARNERVPIAPDAIFALFRRADSDGNAALDKTEFLRMVQDPEAAPFLQRNFVAYVSAIFPLPASREARKSWYSNLSKLTGVRLSLMTLLSLCIAIPFALDLMIAGTTNADGPIARALLFDPRKRSQSWRFATYMLVHGGWAHLTFNVLAQVLLGVPLMAVGGWRRALAAYLCGVLSGSLGASVFAARYPLAGASAGIYALLAARAAHVLLNCRETRCATLRVAFFGSLMTVGSLFGRGGVSWIAHCSGAVAGLFVGFITLRNRRENACERKIQVAFALVFGAMVLSAVGINIFSKQLYK